MSDRVSAPGAHAQRVMAEQVLREEGLAPEPLRRAATVILVRDGAAGAEVLMVRRPETISFAGAWVFPGGSIDDADGLGVASDDDAARAAGVRETREETGLVVDGADLIPIAVWDPPENLPKRIRTWFFLAPAPGGDITAQDGEVVEWRWVRPAEMLEQHGEGHATLYPPTWVTLTRLAGAPATQLLAAARDEPVAHFVTRATKLADGLLFHWGDDDGSADPPERHRLETTSVPWTYRPGSIGVFRP